MDTVSIEQIKADEIISILSKIIQKHIIKTKKSTGGEENE